MKEKQRPGLLAALSALAASRLVDSYISWRVTEQRGTPAEGKALGITNCGLEVMVFWEIYTVSQRAADAATFDELWNREVSGRGFCAGHYEMLPVNGEC